MSLYRDLIARMAIDDEFAVHARGNPDEVARIYRLNPDETEKLRRLVDARLDAGPVALGARLSKSGFGGAAVALIPDGPDWSAGTAPDDVPATEPPPSAERPAVFEIETVPPTATSVPADAVSLLPPAGDDDSATGLAYGAAGVVAGGVIGAAAVSLIDGSRSTSGQ